MVSPPVGGLTYHSGTREEAPAGEGRGHSLYGHQGAHRPNKRPEQAQEGLWGGAVTLGRGDQELECHSGTQG